MDSQNSNYTFGKRADDVCASNKKPNKRLQYSFGVHLSVAEIGSIIKYEYTHITVDAGAAAKFFHLVWNNPVVKNHLGSFHGMLELFSIIGKLVQGSGSEDIKYQTGLCTFGGINGIIAGKHYNRCWFVHESLAEALDRLFCESCGISCPSDLISLVKGIERMKMTVKNLSARKLSKDTKRSMSKEEINVFKGNLGKPHSFG